jgi:hypothetical protein
VTASGNGQLPAQGGAGSLAVSAARECVWSATADGQWLTIRSGANGQGDGAIEFNAAANPDPAVRRGGIVLNEQRVEVTQAAGVCSYSLSEASGSFPQAGGAGQFEVRASSSLCTWTSQSDAPWVTVRAGANSQGTATVRFDVSAAGGGARSATIVAAGLRFSVVQTASNCTYGVAPGVFSASASGDSLTVTVTAGPGCAWTAASTVPWISLSSGGAGAGAGTASFGIAPTSTARSGSVVVAGQTIAVNQGGASAPCAFSIAPEVQNAAVGQSTFSVDVMSSPGCGWTAASNAPWITLDKNGGNGPGNLKVSVAANTGLPRSGTATIAGRTLTINQAGVGCSHRVSPLELRVNDERRVEKIQVETASGCSWTAVSNVEWVTVTLNSSGIGSGEVSVLIRDSGGKTRNGTLTIAGQTVQVHQRNN